MRAPLAAGHDRGHRPGSGGWTTTELLVVMTVASIFLGIVAPITANVKDATRARHAAGYVSSRFRAARQQAIVQERSVALVFDLSADGWAFRMCVDRNGTGVRRAEIVAAIDDCPEGPVGFSTLFPGVAVAVDSTLTGPDGEPGSADPVRFGRSDIASFSPDGSCSAGSIYLRSAQGVQFAVRVAGVTGRTRVLRYDTGADAWKSW